MYLIQYDQTSLHKFQGFHKLDFIKTFYFNEKGFSDIFRYCTIFQVLPLKLSKTQTKQHNPLVADP